VVSVYLQKSDIGNVM